MGPNLNDLNVSFALWALRRFKLYLFLILISLENEKTLKIM
jgi:hypothetical protein